MQRQCAGSCSSSLLRRYSTPRDPRQAENEAATVRGNRAARARLEAHQQTLNGGERKEQYSDYQEGRTFEGDTLGGEWACAGHRGVGG